MLIEMNVEEVLAGLDFIPTEEVEPAPGRLVKTRKLDRVEDVLTVFDEAEGRAVYVRSLAKVELPGKPTCYFFRYCYG